MEDVLKIQMAKESINNGIVIIPDGVTKIGDCAFYDCTSLTNVIIPNSVTKIGDCAFFNCTNLTNVIMPNSVTKIGDFAFAYCKALTKYSSTTVEE